MLEDIGFYTLSDARAAGASETSRLMRCELILTGRCNFRCPYCRRVGGPDIDFEQACETIRLWAADGLYAIRFSGGEPTMYTRLQELVLIARRSGIEKIAVSTNGSAPLSLYRRLIESGVNDLSISLDACCAADGESMTATIGAWERTVENIRALAGSVYITVGIVLTEQNAVRASDVIRFAADLGVSDIRVIPAAQNGDSLNGITADADSVARYPILRYRLCNLRAGRPVRGLRATDSNRCGLALDDMAVCGAQHYPCIIYMREGGAAIGTVGPDMRRERAKWCAAHDTHADPICSRNCLDVCADYNNRKQQTKENPKPIAAIYHHSTTGPRSTVTVELAVSYVCDHDQHRECDGLHHRESEVCGPCDPRCPCACHFGWNVTPKPV